MSRTASENCQMSQRWEKSSSPRSSVRVAAVFRLEDHGGPRLHQAALAGGMPNLVGKWLRMVAMISMGLMACPLLSAPGPPGRRPSVEAERLLAARMAEIRPAACSTRPEGGGRQPEGPGPRMMSCSAPSEVATRTRWCPISWVARSKGPRLGLLCVDHVDVCGIVTSWTLAGHPVGVEHQNDDISA